MNDNRKAQNDRSFDYESRAKAVRKAHRYLGGCSLEDLSDPDFGATHDDRVAIWRKALDEAYPPGFWEAYYHLREKNSDGLPLAIEFLEADPWFFRTGYIKERLIRYILPFELTPDFSARLQNVVLVVVDKRYRREFRAYCQLARKVDSPEFRRRLNERLTETDLNVKRRAQWVLDSLEHGVHRKGEYRQRATARRTAPLSPEFLGYVERLRTGDSELLEEVMYILEDNYRGFFNRDGRMKCEIVRALAEIDLPADSKQRLRTVILSLVDTYYAYGFEHYCHLASKISSPEFRQELSKRLEHSDYHVRRRAQLVLNALETNGDFYTAVH